MTEQQIEKKICDYAEGLGCLVYKLTCPNRRGVPDRLILCPNGKSLFIEVKAPGKKPTDAQEKELKLLMNIGFWAFWVDSVKVATMCIDLAIRDDGGLPYLLSLSDCLNETS